MRKTSNAVNRERMTALALRVVLALFGNLAFKATDYIVILCKINDLRRNGKIWGVFHYCGQPGGEYENT
ncbi:MAG: hypothetical protein HDS68_01145 [Bacteroidales bacterium]|nr:hypothetical protein [Bacteroidales bacterium]